MDFRKPTCCTWLQHRPGSHGAFTADTPRWLRRLLLSQQACSSSAGALRAHLPLAGVQVVDAAKGVLGSLLALHGAHHAVHTAALLAGAVFGVWKVRRSQAFRAFPFFSSKLA